MKYVAICVALYDYQVQTDDEELSFNADDILYILENSDPNWYKAQLKVPSAQDGGPVGIIPSNYVEKAKPISSVKAMYGYQPQSIEEVAFEEDEVMALYENDDPDWFLVEKSNGEIGLAPSNYVEQQETGATTASLFAPSPPTAQQAAPSPILNHSDSALSWSVYEYDVLKKKKTKAKGNLLVGNGMFCYGSETDKSLPVRQFQVNQVLTASIDGKNVHIEINNAEHTVFDFQTALQSEAKSILAKIESSKTASNAAIGLNLPLTTNAVSSASNPVPEVVATSPTPTCEPRWAVALFAFKPETDEETYLQEYEQVLITDYVTSSDWWSIEHKDGTAGIIPANYVKFQDEYEADLQAEDAEEEKRRLEAAAAAKEKQQKEEEDLREKQRQKEMTELNRQIDLEEKERARQAEVDRRRKMQEEAKQKEIDAKRQAAFAANAMASPQMGGGSPRRSQIPAPPPPPPQAQAQAQAQTQPQPQPLNHTTLHSSLPTYNQQPQTPKHVYPNKPDPAKVRMWTDRTGAFKVEAQFLSCANGKIRLFKTNGVKIDVPSQKMCVEDLKYIEQETGIKQHEDKNDNIPLAQLNSQFTWFDYFKKANLPHSACVEYAGNFDANRLTEQDIERLTHGKMKLLGMSERHVQRIQRFIETNKAEPPSDNEDAGRTRAGGLAKPRIRVKKSVTFGAVSYIPEDDDNDHNENDVEWQIQQDEIFARQLQEQGEGNINTGLHRRGTGRPTPSHSAPRDVNSSVLTPQQFEPLKPVPATLIQSPSAPPPPVNNTLMKPAFEDDAWAPRASSSPSVQSVAVAAAANPAWNATAEKSNTPPANVSLPPRQRPTPPLSQQNMVDPELLAKWGGSPALAAANRRPVPPPPTTANSASTPLQAQSSFQSQNSRMDLMPSMHHQGNVTSSPFVMQDGTSLLSSYQPTTQKPTSNGFQQQQPTGSSFAPLQSSVQQQPLFTNNNSSSSLNQYMYNHPTPSVVPLQSVLPPALAPQLTASSFQSTVSSFGSPQLQHQTTGATAGGRNWANATPDNPFGSGAPGNPVVMQPNYGLPQQNSVGFVPQPFAGNNMNSQIDPSDKYSVFKTINSSTPSIFNNQQQQQQEPRTFYY
ncbi:hypothetical protein BD408DRAFT_419417 [Parasitella parasitica]|nr:hypothetical protein BD408DRAFT_419417 [Parasitella parasitica]